jgi:hypothetical protein
MIPIRHLEHKVSKPIVNLLKVVFTIVLKMKAHSEQQSLNPCKTTSTLQVPKIWMSTIFLNKLLKIHNYLKFRVNCIKMNIGCFSSMLRNVRWVVGLIEYTLIMHMIRIGGEIVIWELVKSQITRLCRVEREGN